MDKVVVIGLEATKGVRLATFYIDPLHAHDRLVFHDVFDAAIDLCRRFARKSGHLSQVLLRSGDHESILFEASGEDDNEAEYEDLVDEISEERRL